MNTGYYNQRIDKFKLRLKQNKNKSVIISIGRLIVFFAIILFIFFYV